MPDLSHLSDAELQALYQPQSVTPGGVPVGPSARPRVVIGPDPVQQMSDADLKSAYDAHNTSTLSDVAQSIPSGLASGVIGLTGMVPDISSTMHNAANKYLFDPVFNAISGPKPDAPAPPDITKMFGSQNIQS